MARRRLRQWLVVALAGLARGLGGAADHAVILQHHHLGDHTPAATSVTVAQWTARMRDDILTGPAPNWSDASRRPRRGESGGGDRAWSASPDRRLG